MKNYKYKFSHTILFSLLALLSFSFVLTSCDKDDEDNGTQIWTVGPGNVNRGDILKVSGQKISDISAVILPSLDGSGIEISSSEFLNKTENYFEVKLPNDKNFVSGNVIFKLSNGNTITSKVSIKVGALVLEGFSPATAKAGDEITITGDYLTLVETVTFASNQSVKKDDFVSQSNTEIKVILPDAAQTGNIAISDGDGTAYSDTQISVTLPTVTSIEDKIYKPGVDKITINGKDLDIVRTVKFEGVDVTKFESQSETAITIVVPAEAKPGNIFVVPASEINVEAGQIELVDPIIDGIEYPSDLINYFLLGQEVTFKGSNLDLISSIKLGGIDVADDDFKVSDDNNYLTITLTDSVKSGAVFTTKNGTQIDKILNIEPFIIYKSEDGTTPWGQVNLTAGATNTIQGENLQYLTSIVVNSVVATDIEVSADGKTLTYKVAEKCCTDLGEYNGQWLGKGFEATAKNGDVKKIDTWVSAPSYPYLIEVPDGAAMGTSVILSGINLDKVVSATVLDEKNSETELVYSIASNTKMFVSLPNKTGKYCIKLSDGENSSKTEFFEIVKSGPVVLWEGNLDLAGWGPKIYLKLADIKDLLVEGNVLTIFGTDCDPDGCQIQCNNNNWKTFMVFVPKSWDVKDGQLGVDMSKAKEGFSYTFTKEVVDDILANAGDDAIIIQGDKGIITKVQISIP